MARQVMESFMHEESSFLTLTYDNDHLPAGGTLVPKDFQDWLKRFRKWIAPDRVRFFGVGEYGDESGRPHYHASLFGVGECLEPVVRETWGKGHVMLAEFNEVTAQYVAGYVVKKMTAKDDLRLNGRHPEFSRQSNRPGIGASAMQVLADAVLTDQGLDEFLATGDVPIRFQIGKRSFPLGRYLRQKLREEVGVSEEQKEKIKERFFAEWDAEMLELRIREVADYKAEKTVATAQSRLVRSRLQARRNIESRANIRKKRITL